MKNPNLAKNAPSAPNGDPGLVRIVQFFTLLYADLAILSRHEGATPKEARDSCRACLREHLDRWSQDLGWAAADAETISIAAHAAIERALSEFKRRDPCLDDATIRALRARWAPGLRATASALAVGSETTAIVRQSPKSGLASGALPASVEMKLSGVFDHPDYRHPAAGDQRYSRPAEWRAEADRPAAPEKAPRRKGATGGRTVRTRVYCPPAEPPRHLSPPVAAPRRPLPEPPRRPALPPAVPRPLAEPTRHLALPAAGTLRATGRPEETAARARHDEDLRRGTGDSGLVRTQLALPAPANATGQGAPPPGRDRDDIGETPMGK